MMEYVLHPKYVCVRKNTFHQEQKDPLERNKTLKEVD